MENVHWIVSYDDATEIRRLYSDCQMIEYDMFHMAATSKKAKELVFFSPTLHYDTQKLPPNFKLRKSKTKKRIVYNEKN